MPKAKPKRSRRSQKSRLLRPLKRFSGHQSVLVAGLLVLLGLVYIVASHAAGPGYDTSAAVYDVAGQAKLKPDPAQGLDYTGLKLVKANANHPCRGEFEITDVKPNGQPICTHGPDPIPDDVSKVTPQQRIHQLARLPQIETTPEQLAAQEIPQQAAGINGYEQFNNQFALAPLPCTSGQHRIQLVLMTHDTNAANNDFVKSLLKQTARRVESQLLYSSTHSGPGSTKRYFRFITDPTCHPTVATIVVPSGPFGISLATPQEVTQYLDNHGYNGKYTKYLVWDNAVEANFCGMGTRYPDNQPSALNNENNNRTGYAVLGPECWGTTNELHEIAHALGAVHNDAPHSTGGGHCRDKHDELCYNDGGYCLISGRTVPCGVNGKSIYVSSACAEAFLDWLLDCSKNDYFNSGTVSSTNYLYKHWNIANSPYMQR